jgi:hypothetical protein
MKKNSTSQSGLFNPRAFVAFTLCCVVAFLVMVSFAADRPRPATPTFGHPIISGIGGVGFEQGLRLDPSNPNRLYTSVPGSASSDTSWIWHSIDAGKTFKWVVGATALEGKVTTCFGGGDTETGVDSAGHLYFADLTLANLVPPARMTRVRPSLAATPASQTRSLTANGTRPMATQPAVAAST